MPEPGHKANPNPPLAGTTRQPAGGPPEKEAPKAPQPTAVGKAATVGAMVEFRQHRKGGEDWLPFLVTHVHNATMVSGVAFSGEPGAIGWHRGSMEFSQVVQGTENRQWRWPSG